jgi:protein-S-isoprenylcysteine O-methyltransferase Ste14
MCSLVKITLHFGGTNGLHLQTKKQAEQEPRMKKLLLSCLLLFAVSQSEWASWLASALLAYTILSFAACVMLFLAWHILSS